MKSAIYPVFQIFVTLYIFSQFQIYGFLSRRGKSNFCSRLRSFGSLKRTSINVYIHPYFSNSNSLRLYQVSPSSVGRQSAIPPTKSYSFVRDELRPYAMELHTKDQAKEGKQQEQTPFTKWTPTLHNYLQFLVDSLEVYQTFEALINQNSALTLLRNTGLERSPALVDDIEWMLQFDGSLTRPICGQAGHSYAEYIKGLLEKSLPRFICHYYNFYFAHTAGGRMIGLKMADLLLDRHTLKFYQWNGDLKAILEQTKDKIDDLAIHWDETERKECLEETLTTFEFGGSLMMYLNPH